MSTPANGPVGGDGPLDRVSLRGVRAHGRHGWHAAEREHGQEFVVDVTLLLDTRAAAASDQLSDTVDYSALAARVAALVQGEPVLLLETLAHGIAAECLRDTRAAAVEVTVHKPHAALGVPFDDVSVTVSRSRAL